MTVFIKRFFLRVLSPLVLIFLPVVAHAEPVKATYLYNLSSFTGTVPLDWARICTDPVNKEVYVSYGDTIRIFNQTGMEVYRFGAYDVDAGTITDMAVDPEGRLLLLSYKMADYEIVISDYRGRRKGSFLIQNLPPEFAGFAPGRMVYQEGRLYFAQLSELKIVVTDLSGKFLDGYDVARILEVKDDQRAENDIFAISVTKKGEILLTIPAMGKAFVVTADKTTREFGKRGSGPGKFGVPAGIATDREGNIYVSDILRSVVLIFDKDRRFVSEFGGRGMKPGKFIVPRDLVVDSDNRVYVTQLRKRGVSVFRIDKID